MTCIFLLMLFLSLPGDVTEFDLSNGIHVVSRTFPGGEVEGVSVFLEGGSRVLSVGNQGIEALALEAAMAGSQRFPDGRWRAVMDSTLAEWTASYNYDYSRYHLKCLSGDLPLLLDGFADCLINPALDSASVTRIQNRMVSSAAAELDDPDNRIWMVANRGFMGEDHPYMLRPEGYSETLESFTVEDIAAWLERRVRSGNMVIVHAGPTAPDELRDILEETFAGVPSGEDRIPEVPPFEISVDTLSLELDETPTAFSVVKFQAPPPGHSDRAAFETACAVVDELLWQVLRTENALTYATYAGSTGSYARNWGYMYVSTPDPALANELMVTVFRRVAEGRVEPDLVTGVAAGRRTLAGIRGESMETQCWILGSGYLATGDWRTFYLLDESLGEVTAEDAGRVLSHWAEHAGWGIIADSTLVNTGELIPIPLEVNPQ